MKREQIIREINELGVWGKIPADAQIMDSREWLKLHSVSIPPEHTDKDNFYMLGEGEATQLYYRAEIDLSREKPLTDPICAYELGISEDCRRSFRYDLHNNIIVEHCGDSDIIPCYAKASWDGEVWGNCGFFEEGEIPPRLEELYIYTTGNYSRKQIVKCEPYINPDKNELVFVPTEVYYIDDDEWQDACWEYDNFVFTAADLEEYHLYKAFSNFDDALYYPLTPDN